MGKKVLGLVATAAISAITGGFGAPLAFSFSSFATSLVLGGLSYALSSAAKDKPKGGSLPETDIGSSTVAVRQSDISRQKPYGHTRITRGYAHMKSTGLNGVLHMILMLCDGELRAINEIWVNDYCIPPDWIDADGNITQGRYAGYLTIRKHLGSNSQLADDKAVLNMPEWTADHRLQGIAYLYITMKKNQDVFPTGVPNFSAIVEGALNYDPRAQANAWSTNIAIYCRDFLTNNDYGFGAFADDINDANISSQANICDEIVTVSSKDYTMSSVDISTNILTLQGTLNELQFGDRVQIVTAGTPPAGLSTGVNYYVIPYQILTTPRIMLATSLDNAMAKIAIDITSTGSGTIVVRKNGEPRYHGSGIHDRDYTLSKTLNDLCNSMAGRAVCVGGRWTLLAGAWRSPDITLNEKNVRGQGIGFKSALSMSESYNVVKGLYVSQLNLYQESDYPSARYQEFIDDDGGLEATKEIALPYTTRPDAATRIAKIELFRGRQGIAVNADFDLSTLQVQCGDNIGFSMAHLGWDDKAFEVTQWGLQSNDDGGLVVGMSLRETALEIFDWSSGEAIDFDPAPNTNLPDPFTVFAVTGIYYNSRFIETRDGDAVYTLTLGWDPHPDAFVTEFGAFEIQYKLSDETSWRPSFFVDGKLVSTDVLNSSVNVPYDLRIRARNSLGVRSGWVSILGAVVGSSGGVTDTMDWRLITEAVVPTFDFQTITDPVGSGDHMDWGYIV